MKTLPRQLYFEPSLKQRVYLKQKNYEQIVRKTHRSHLSIQEAISKRMLNFQHRRKYQLPEFKHSILFNNSRQSEQIENNKFHEKSSRMGEVKRHTYCGSDHMQGQTINQVRRKRIKDNSPLSKTVCHQYFTKTASGWKVKEAGNKIQQKTEKAQSQDMPIKDIKRAKCLRQKNNQLNLNTQVGSFVSLMQKFKFQNLKTAKKNNCLLHMSDYSHKQDKKQRITDNEFTSARKTFACNFAKQQVDNKLVPLFPKKNSKVVRKLSSLTPWQHSAENQVGSTVQMVLHI